MIATARSAPPGRDHGDEQPEARRGPSEIPYRQPTRYLRANVDDVREALVKTQTLTQLRRTPRRRERIGNLRDNRCDTEGDFPRHRSGLFG